MAELRLYISGLCGFVPSGTLDPQNPITAVRVLLPDARGQHPAHGPHQPEHHEPVLKVQKDYVVSGVNIRPPDRIYTPPGPNPPTWYFYYLADQDLTIVAPSGGVTADTGGTPPCPTNSDLTSFDWVAPMGSINPGFGAVDPTCLRAGGNPALPVSPSVVARVRFTQGKLTNSRFARDQGLIHAGKILDWRFRTLAGTGTSTHTQALSEEVRLLHTFGTPTIDLQTTYFRFGSTSPQTIRLQNIGADHLAIARILNMPWPDLFELRTGGPGDRPVDFHFEHFHDIVNNAAMAVRRVPDPNPRTHCPNVNDPGPQVSSPQCPPTRYDPDASA